ncbi:MAG TPA: putative sulfate exporter family transporter [Novosphingobium sp.]|nr:putative sulfate exporter family transporter [Novosphingobium sp.]
MTQPLSPRRLLPGLALALVISALAYGVEWVEIRLWGRAYLEALVVAILLGAVWRTVIGLPVRAASGIRFAAKPVMEGAVALMGASVSLAVLAHTGLALAGAIAGTIALTILAGYRIGRWLGLPVRMALLVACGNAICGNSAIAAVAPAIDADGEDVAAAVGFTAVMGIVVVLAVAPLAWALQLSPVQGGMLAGMTVYAVPQVLAAAGPLGAMAVQVGAVVKLVRVLMLAPVVAVLSVLGGKAQAQEGMGAGGHLARLVPGFILVFLGLAGLRSLGLVGDGLAALAHGLSMGGTVVAMAGLGLGVDLRQLRAAGPRVSAAVVLSLVVLFAGALAVIHWLG